MTIPIATSPGRSGFGPQLALSYDSGSGNGPFGFGWSLSLPSITRKTDKGLPKYQDAEDSDVFILSGAEDLVPEFRKDQNGNWIVKDGKYLIFEDDRYLIFDDPRTPDRKKYRVRRYRPRIEGLFARIERWTNLNDPQDTFWRSISRDNISTWYGRTAESRIFDPDDESHIFSWLICQSYDDKGNAIVYEYVPENSDRILEDADGNIVPLVHERNRELRRSLRSANRYLKRIKYGNRLPNRRHDHTGREWVPYDPAMFSDDAWMFEVVFDYGEADFPQPGNGSDEQRFVLVDLTKPEEDGKDWPVRRDPFSSYRAGFEVRTYRLCRRALMLHHFPRELGINNYLVRSTDFTYSPGPIASFLTGVTQSGYLHQSTPDQPNRYFRKSLPPVQFTYSKVPEAGEFAALEIEDLDPESLENLPVGLDGAAYQWVDLDGEGAPGILTEQADGWFYKRNLSANHLDKKDGQERAMARFAPTELVGSKPAGGLAGGAQFLDLAGNGQVDLVQMNGSVRGYFERTHDAAWSAFEPFESWPNVDPRDPNLKFVDLTGDGHADILVSEDQVFLWYESRAEAGYRPATRIQQAIDEENGPRLVFDDATESFYLADLSGDGLTDLARIRNGEVCYWPNLGYGRFGARVTMDDSPWFDSPDQFDQKRVRLADIDGSGVTDILYLRRDGVQIYLNQSGNRWSGAVPLPQFPPVDNLSSVQVLDLLGNGTACLVWSSPLPGAALRPMKYLALMKEKPHLLVKILNNLGAETVVTYAPSTRFYLNDKKDGRPWITRLPFPVHVIERVETYDYISRNGFVTCYKYHHGYFDGPEREFRGFGMVEQRDTEEFASLSESRSLQPADNENPASNVPPVVTKTWFHTGVALRGQQISLHLAHEYFGAPLDPAAFDLWARHQLLDDTVLPDEALSADEIREACRSLKGAMLRQEIYAEDGSEKELLPYSAAEQNFTIKRLQPQGDNRHAVFFTHARESVTHHYERNLGDPRVGHTLTLEVDKFGNVLKTAAVGYGRRQPDLSLPLQKDRDDQTRTLVTYTENVLTNEIDTSNDYRPPLAAETRTYELTGYTTTGPAGRYQASDFVERDPDRAGHLIHIYEGQPQYEQTPPGGKQRRLIEHVRTLYRRDDMTGLLPLGSVGSLALPGESYKLAFTPGLLEHVYNRPLDIPQPVGAPPPEELLQTPPDVLGGPGPNQGGYMPSQKLRGDGLFPNTDPDDLWWVPSGKVFFYVNSWIDPPASADRELYEAREHFYMPREFLDPYNNRTTVAYDGYDLILKETRDMLENVVTVNTQDDISQNTTICIDYRVLQPYWMTDPNQNRTRVLFDALGMVVATAVMGKPGQDVGDLLQDMGGGSLPADVTTATMQAFSSDPHAQKTALLGRATTRIGYDLDRWKRDRLPPYAATLARETHYRPGRQQSKIQVSFSYSDGFGREIQKKIQAEPGPVPGRGPGDVDPRWVGSGWTIYNNKGKPVRQFEPFFSDTPDFEFGVRVGVSPILFYDPLERVVATLHPNHTYEKVLFDPWQQTTWDVNDTLHAPQKTGEPPFNPKDDPDVGGYFERLPQSEYLPTWYDLRMDDTKAQGQWPDADAAGRPLPDNAKRRVTEKRASIKAAVHADTPTVAYFDTLGRTFLTVAQNKFKRMKDLAEETGEAKHRTRIVLDIEGNQREVRDERMNSQNVPEQRVVMRYDYDLLGNRIHQHSMDAGERWMLNDVTGKPIRAWDSRGFERRISYDVLRRPVELAVNGQPPEITVYGETEGNRNNHRTRVYQVVDSAGLVTNEIYDFKGNLQQSKRELTPFSRPGTHGQPDPDPYNGTFVTQTEYDALNRPITVTSPDGSIYRPEFNEANLLDKVEVNLRGKRTNANQLEWTPFVRNIDYNAKGQRTEIEYNQPEQRIITKYAYDPTTFRLTGLVTERPNHSDVPKRTLQKLSYTYDPVGNITHILDRAQPRIFFDNDCIDASSDYQYDAIYRLIAASGREHRGQDPQPDWDDSPRMNNPIPFDCQEMQHYVETYYYDEVGNILQMSHHAGGNLDRPGTVIWNRRYQYSSDNNRLLSTSVPGETALPPYFTPGNRHYGQLYDYDEHGNMEAMPHLPTMTWDFKDQLSSIETPDGGTAYYVYDLLGQRVRKVIYNQNGKKTKERIYLGGFEIYREYNGAGGETPELERETLHIMDDKQRIALVETKTIPEPTPPAEPEQLIRYQLGNHLGSAMLELDAEAEVITYEEYHPYGSTSYQARRSQTEAWKRYRYTGKERDEESGLYYHGARYYAPWLGRWMSCDPWEMEDGVNLYFYVINNPVRSIDSTGKGAEETKKVNPEMTSVQPKGTVERFAVRFTDPETGKSHVQIIDKAIPASNELMNFEVFSEEKGVPKASGEPSTQTPGQKIFHKYVKGPGIWVEIISEHAEKITSNYATKQKLKRGDYVFMKEGRNFTFVDTTNLADVKQGTKAVYGTGELGTPPRLRRGGVDLGPIKTNKNMQELAGVAGDAMDMASHANTFVASGFIFEIGAKKREDLTEQEISRMYLAGYELEDNVFASLGYAWTRTESGSLLERWAASLVGVHGPKYITPGVVAEAQRAKFQWGLESNLERRIREYENSVKNE